MKNKKKQFYLRWDECLLLFGVEVIFFLFGEILLAVVTYGVYKDGIFELGTMLALIAPLFIVIVLGCSTLGMCFNLGISMCDTRKRLVPMFLMMTYLECLMIAAIAYLFHHLELWIFQTFYPGLKNEMDFGFLFQWKYILVVCIVITAVQALFGALFLRYGKVAYWIIWSLWMILCIGGPKIAEFSARHQNTMVMQVLRRVWGYFSGITENSVLCGLTGVAVILILVSYLMLRRQQVSI